MSRANYYYLVLVEDFEVTEVLTTEHCAGGRTPPAKWTRKIFRQLKALKKGRKINIINCHWPALAFP